MNPVDSSADLDELLEQCTVKLSVPGKSGWGTGFFVAPGKILTCAHVVKDAGEQLVKVCWQDREDFAEASVSALFRDPVDVALLDFSLADSNHPCVYLDTAVKSGDDLYTYGYPDDFANGAPVTGQCEGLTGDALPIIKFKAGRVRSGLSGSPLLNRRTHKVCGIVKFTLDRSIDLGGGAIATTTIWSKFGELKELQTKFHQQDQRWQSLLPSRRCSLRTVLLSSLGIAAFVIVVRFLAILQPLELWAFDMLLQMRPPEQADPRLLVIEIDANDYEQREKAMMQTPGMSISDGSLVELIQLLEKYKPNAIAVDLYREFTGDSLKPLFKNSPILFAPCKAPEFGQNASGQSEVIYPGIAPPQGIPDPQVGFSDFVQDGELLVRRQLMLIEQKEAPCTATTASSLLLAKHYLEAQGVAYHPPEAPQLILKFGDTPFQRLYPPYGGYQSIDSDGYQILLNYRSVCLNGSCSPRNIAKKLSLREVLNERKLTKADVEGKVVLIGSSVENVFKDIWNTPYGEKLPGVYVQAQMISQILSKTLDRRLLLQVWPFGIESLWIVSWALIGGMLAWRIESRRLGILAGAIAIIVLPGLCLGFLLIGSWVPLVPPVLAVLLSSGWITYKTFRLRG